MLQRGLKRKETKKEKQKRFRDIINSISRNVGDLFRPISSAVKEMGKDVTDSQKRARVAAKKVSRARGGSNPLEQILSKHEGTRVIFIEEPLDEDV